VVRAGTDPGGVTFSAACISALLLFSGWERSGLFSRFHAQCFVNSVCHTDPEVAPGEDSSRNVRWLALMQFCQGENWHRNHHARPGLAPLGWNWRQPDVGYLAICLLQKVGLATEVRHIRQD
jgi:fatty-acid desaturase